MNVTLLQIIFLFFAYSLLGWCCEVVFAAVNSGKFVNRGFLSGPVCPIYGYGILLSAAALQPLMDNLPLLFAGAALLTSAIELAVGFICEKLLGMRLWDYSEQPFNIGGYVCLKFTLLWGLGFVFVLKLVHPAVMSLVALLPEMALLVCDIVFTAVFVADLTVTLTQALKLPKRLRAIEEVQQSLQRMSVDIGGSLAERAIAARAKGEQLAARAEQTPRARELKTKLTELTESVNAVHDRLLSAFPALSRGVHAESVASLKQAYARRLELFGRWLRGHRYVWLTLYVPVYLLAFFVLEHAVTADYWVSYLPLDDLIPFCEYFVVPYCLWYPFLVLSGLYLLIKDGDGFKRYMYFIIIGFSASLLICALFPNGQDLRPAVLPNSGFFCQIIGYLYSIDTNTNVLPSMHVVGCTAAVCALLSSPAVRSKWLKAGAVLLSLLIVAATVLIKQHSVLDIFAAIALCIPVFFVVYGRSLLHRGAGRELMRSGAKQ